MQSKDHSLLEGLLGDFIALAVSDVSIFNTHIEAQLILGGHAGLTAEESSVPFIVIEKER